MTQNDSLDCITDLRVKDMAKKNQCIIQQHLISLQQCLKDIHSTNCSASYLDSLLDNIGILKKNLSNTDAFIVVELLNTTEDMLSRVKYLNINLNNNVLQVIEKCVNQLACLFKQYIEDELILTDETVWCLEAADSINNTNNCFFFDVGYPDNFNQSMLFGKKINNTENKETNNYQQLTTHNCNIKDNNTFDFYEIEKNTTTIFLKENLYIAKKTNDLFTKAVKTQDILKYSYSIIQSLNLLKLAAVNFHYDDIAFTSFCIAKIYNCAMLFSVDFTKQLITILAKLHAILIKQLDIAYDNKIDNNEIDIKNKIKLLYTEFLQASNLINKNDISTNNDFYHSINYGNLLLFSEYNTNKLNNNKETSTNICTYAIAANLKYQLKQLINVPNLNIDINITPDFLNCQLYQAIVLTIKHISNKNLYHNLLDTNQDTNNNIRLNIYKNNTNLIIALETNLVTINKNHILKTVEQNKILENNKNMRNYLPILLQIQHKSANSNNNLHEIQLVDFYKDIRKLGGSLVINESQDNYVNHEITIPITDIKNNMLLVEFNKTTYALDTNIVIQILELNHSKNINDMNIIDLSSLTSNTKHTASKQQYSIIISIDNKKHAVIVDKVLGFKELLIKRLEFPFIDINGINAVAYTENKKMAFVVNPPSLIKNIIK